MTHAINQVIEINFAKTSPKIDLFLLNGTEESEKICDLLLTKSNVLISYRVIKMNFLESSRIFLNTSSILLFNSYRDLEENFKTIVWQNNGSGVRYKHLVFFPNSMATDFQFLSNGFVIDQVSFITRDPKQNIILMTNYMYSPSACKSPRFFTINLFNVSTLRWILDNESDFFRNKYRNLHGCLMRVGVTEINEEVRNILSSYTKFANGRIGFIPTKNTSGFDFLTKGGSLSQNPNLKFIVTFPYIFDHLTFFIPRGEEFTALEKALQPFETDLWIGIMILLSVVFLSSILVEILSKKLSSIFFDTSSPTIEYVATFLVGVQNQVPRQNFARFCLMMFIIWSLIIRTCYQSELFKHLQSDRRKPEVKSILEMISRNFTFINSGLIYPVVNSIADSNGLQR
jgi:hypothetical protein